MTFIKNFSRAQSDILAHKLHNGFAHFFNYGEFPFKLTFILAPSLVVKVKALLEPPSGASVGLGMERGVLNRSPVQRRALVNIRLVI